ncbi:MAG: hypothetical protein P1V20_23505 [Verrucomicrobiales bacterium]|nr:hypothetical protein [Verrucomicrobiales bacterium]
MPIKPQFQELDYRKTDLGELILRRRTILSLDNLEVYEIILGDAFLMSSLFTVVEEELSRIGLAAASAASPYGTLDVVVGGLGLGYTAVAALENPAVKSLRVVDYLEPVIEWHREGLVPLGKTLTGDSRCELVHGDFFELALKDKGIGFDSSDPNRKFHAILLDIDHSPDNLLHETNAAFYRTEGLQKLKQQLHPEGVFGLWSDAPPEANFMDSLAETFATCESHVVEFYNPLQDITSRSTVYIATKEG